MPLDHEALTNLAVSEYFLACNRGDVESMLAIFSEDAQVRFMSAGFRYRGLTALRAHLEEFRDTFPVIEFRDFDVIADVSRQCVAVRFELELGDPDGTRSLMRNCNVFYLNAEGRVRDMFVYDTAPLDEGFAAGNAQKDQD
jgi:ketosteroid isomerase-like protein